MHYKYNWFQMLQISQFLQEFQNFPNNSCCIWISIDIYKNIEKAENLSCKDLYYAKVINGRWNIKYEKIVRFGIKIVGINTR